MHHNFKIMNINDISKCMKTVEGYKECRIFMVTKFHKYYCGVSLIFVIEQNAQSHILPKKETFSH